MDGLRVGVAVRWPEVRAVVCAVLRRAGHRAIDSDPPDPTPPDVVVRDAGWQPPRGWADRPAVILSGGWAAGRLACGADGEVCLPKPFTPDQLDAAIRRAARPA